MMYLRVLKYLFSIVIQCFRISVAPTIAVQSVEAPPHQIKLSWSVSKKEFKTIERDDRRHKPNM